MKTSKIITLYSGIKQREVMRESNQHATTTKSKIQCLEVLISKSFLAVDDNLFWTLSVYSLENQPVEKKRALHNSEIFHFMVFDWERTIQHLLDEHQIPYSIIQHFSPDTLFVESVRVGQPTDDAENDLAALSNLEEEIRRNVRIDFSSSPRETVDLL